ncbi:MAG: sulfur oxidation protein SoxY [Burkholderiales bacterium]|nr:sulfur oxidation protein SoxY [Burkholderiales bacterium]
MRYVRRAWLARAAVAVVAWPVVLRPGLARATPESLVDALRETFGEAVPSMRRERLKLEIVPIAEDGNVVPVAIELPGCAMTAADHVDAAWLFAERNPLPRVAAFTLGPHNGRARVATRMRLAESQRVLGVMRTSDGALWSAEAQVEVARTACG